MTDVLPNKEKFDAYAKLGLVDKRNHPDFPISIYSYSIFTNYERLWNRVTMNARGIAFDEKGRCVIRCMPKFFNDTEPHALCEMDLKEKQVYYDKLDGSLIQIVNDPEYGLLISSKGSFSSNHANWAREIFEEKFSLDDFASGKTYVFELIHPKNRIVLDYGDRRGLYLLAVIDIETGKDHDIYSPYYDKFERVGIVEDIEKHLEQDSIEGVVVKTGNHRYKVKSGEYVRLHRIVTEFTPKSVWSALSSGSSLEFPNMPEEFQSWLDGTVAEIQLAFDTVMDEVKSEAERTKHLGNRELGLASDVKYKNLVFNYRNGKDISEVIWRMVKPKEENSSDRNVE